MSDSVRLTLVAAAATAVTKLARFPQNEPLERPDDRLTPLRADRVLAGPELRCAQTAAVLGVEAVEDPLLRDLGLGSWAGQDLPSLVAADPAALQGWMTDPAAVPHGGESLSALVGRVAELLADDFPHQTVAITSPWMLRAAVTHVLEASPLKMFAIDIAPLEAVHLTRRRSGWQLRGIGPLAQR